MCKGKKMNSLHIELLEGDKGKHTENPWDGVEGERIHTEGSHLDK